MRRHSGQGGTTGTGNTPGRAATVARTLACTVARTMTVSLYVRVMGAWA